MILSPAMSAVFGDRCKYTYFYGEKECGGRERQRELPGWKFKRRAWWLQTHLHSWRVGQGEQPLTTVTEYT